MRLWRRASGSWLPIDSISSWRTVLASVLSGVKVAKRPNSLPGAATVDAVLWMHDVREAGNDMVPAGSEAQG